MNTKQQVDSVTLNTASNLQNISLEQATLVSGGSNQAARQRAQTQRENLYGEADRSTLNCVSASVVGAGMSILGPVGAVVGAGFAAYVCEKN